VIAKKWWPLVLIAAAALEVTGDAAMRRQVKGRGLVWALFGIAALSLYGWLVTHLDWKFSDLLGGYVFLFALGGVLWGKYFEGEQISMATKVGLGVIFVGSAIIQIGATRV